MAQDLATTVELLSQAIEVTPTDRLDQSDAERLCASLDASFETLQRIRRHIKHSI
jgi:hypothetical protein